MPSPETKWLLDTAILVDLLRGSTAARRWVDSVPKAARSLSVATVAELIAGCRNRKEQSVVEREIELYTVLWVTEGISQSALDLYKRFYLSHGVGFLDCLIAATATEHRLRLATLNLSHFTPVPNLQVERPY
ncbi:MAG: type II toxin-antitoxin system VapC family toxin [Planctomycetes bacterium]|nr:type II toxin-antitoxin system VapC family toxin [Planctomycetota bacterium]